MFFFAISDILEYPCRNDLRSSFVNRISPVSEVIFESISSEPSKERLPPGMIGLGFLNTDGYFGIMLSRNVGFFARYF